MAGAQNEVAVVTSSKDNLSYVIDPVSGTQLSLFKNNTCDSGGTAVIAGRNAASGPYSAGDYLVAAQKDKLILQFWCWSKDQPLLKCHTPEKLGPVAVTHNGAFCVGGGKSGKIYLWEVATGKLLKFWDAHYKAVSSLVFLDDDSHLVSGGDDALLAVWRLSDLLDQSDLSEGLRSQQNLSAVRVWTQHSLPISSIVCGTGGVNGRIFSCSLDATVKVWDIPSDRLLYSVVLPSSVRCIALDPTEVRLYAGCSDGRICELSLDVAAFVAQQAAASGQSQAVAAAHDTALHMRSPLAPAALVGHTSAVTSIAVTTAQIWGGGGRGRRPQKQQQQQQQQQQRWRHPWWCEGGGGGGGWSYACGVRL